MIIDGQQFRNAIQLTIARIGQPVLAFGIMQAFLQSRADAPELFPVLWGVSHTIFVFFMGLIISAQNYAVQSDGDQRLAIFNYIARRIVGLAITAACIYGLVVFWLTGGPGWSLLIAAYIVSSVLNAMHNTLHELAARRNRSILVNWVWIGVLVFVVAVFDMLPLVGHAALGLLPRP